MIKLKLYKQNDNRSVILQIIVGVLGLLGIYLLFPNLDKSVLIILFFLILGYVMITEKPNKTIGLLFLGINEIKLETIDINIELNLYEIEKFELFYSGYKGKKVVGDFVPRFNVFSGIDNYIKIDILNKKRYYKFLVDDQAQENQIFNIIEQWELSGYDMSKISINKKNR